MPKYLVDVLRKQEASATVEVYAGTSWAAREKALEMVDEDECDFSTFNTEYEVAGNPVYVRADEHVNKFTPYWEMLASTLKELGYTFVSDEHEDEPSHFAKGHFVMDGRQIAVEIYLSADNKDKTERGNISINPCYPTFEFDHRNDPYKLQLGLSLTPATIKKRLTKFVTAYEKAYVDSLQAKEELASANQKGKSVADRINQELGIVSYAPLAIFAYRRDNKIIFSVSNSEGIHNPDQYVAMARILQEEGIVTCT